MKKVLFSLVILVILVFLLIPSCASETTGLFTREGTIKFIDLEGGFYGINGDDGVQYDPVNLNSNFKVDGLRVRFYGTVVDDRVNIHQWGTLVSITEIEDMKAST